MSVRFGLGMLTFGAEEGRPIEIIVLQDGHIRPATADDRYIFEDEYAAFRNPPSAPVSDGVSSSVPAAGADATGAGATPPPSAG